MSHEETELREGRCLPRGQSTANLPTVCQTPRMGERGLRQGGLYNSRVQAALRTGAALCKGSISSRVHAAMSSWVLRGEVGRRVFLNR